MISQDILMHYEPSSILLFLPFLGSYQNVLFLNLLIDVSNYLIAQRRTNYIRILAYQFVTFGIRIDECINFGHVHLILQA